MLLQLEQECLDVYNRKVDLAVKSRAHLLQSLADAQVAQVEYNSFWLALGEKSFVGIPDNTSGTIKEQLSAIAPILEQLWKQKDERIKEFSVVQSQIQMICGQITGTNEKVGSPVVDMTGLSLKKLDEFHAKLQELQKEKLQELAKQLIDLWNLMDTSEEEKSLFGHVTCNVAASVDEVTILGTLALDLIEQLSEELL